MTAMSKTHLSLYFLSLLISLFYVSSSSSFILDDDPVVGLVACRPRQIQAFRQFKNEFDTHHCNHSDNLNGVRCDNSTGEITALRLNACLSGTLKPNSSLFKLQHLRYLNLSYNNFISSPLPSEFGHLNRLQVLSLFSNGFSGQVPSSFNNLTLLSYLRLAGNDLSGSFPHVWNLTKLSYLSLADNHFSGPVNTNSGLFELHHLRFLNLEINNFSSSIPSELGNLNRLETLSISNNNGFFGQVPPTISNLTQLIQLFLNGNELRGSFPPVQNLTYLSRLDVVSNNFSGTIPSSLLTMPSLSLLDIRENHLTGSFEVPNSSTSSRLKILFLGYNQFDAQILEPISKLINLTDIDLSFLNTSYPIDLGIFTPFHSLVNLILSGNKIYPASLSLDAYIPLTLRKLRLRNCGIKEFPNILKTLRNLEYIDISVNLMKGKIPEWLWSLPRVGTIVLEFNSFNGFQGSAEALVNSSVRVLFMNFNNIEGALPDLPLSINILSASFNNFRGEIPLSICDRTSLDGLDLAGNNFTGPVPQCLSNFVFVNLRNNNLEGSIPDVFRLGASLQILDVGFNQITGKLPRSLLNCSSLTSLSVDNNKMEDTFPFFLKALSNLQVLILSSNKLYGPISLLHQGPLGFPKLRIYMLADNKFTGSLSPTYFVDWNTINEDGGLYMVYDLNTYGIPYLYGNLMDLQQRGVHMEQVQVLNSYSFIDLSGNLLEGNIPESIGSLELLIALNLSNNAFTGHIPLSLANLKKLESLDMSRNQLSGTIPNGLGGLSFLAYINVSHNQLQGEIPQGTQITGQAKSSFEGNAGLCGLPLNKSCFDTSAPPAQHHKQEDDEEEEEEVLNWKGVAIGYGLGVLFGLVIAQVVVSYKPEWLANIIGPNKRRNR